MKNSRFILWALAIAILESGCAQYSYPSNQPSSASSLNTDLIASYAVPKTAVSSFVNVLSMTCQGMDYVVTTHFEHGFDKVVYASLQYQVLNPTTGQGQVFTVPTGIMDLDATQQSGDVQLIIPGSKVTEKNSDILLRLKLRSNTVFESLSPQEQIHVSELCQ